MAYAEAFRGLLDSCKKHSEGVFKQEEKKKKGKAFDSADDPIVGADDYTVKDLAVKVASTIQQWCEEDDLDDGETAADRLMMMLIGIADANQDGEIDDDEQTVLDMALNAAWDYLSSKGVSDEDAGALLNDWDADAADRVRDLVTGALPDGDDAAADVNNFAFGGGEDTQSVFDHVYDAVYRKTFAIRGGKKQRINKRISGKVRLSPKQKVAIRKAQMKAHSAGAMIHRMKSNRMRRKMGL